MGEVLLKSTQADKVDVLGGDPGPLGSLDTVQFETELDVGLDCPPGKQTEVLEHHATVPTGRDHLDAIDHDLPFVGRY